MLETVRARLRGRKTYLVAAIAILSALLSWVNGDASLFDAVDTILLALGIGSLRAGMKGDLLSPGSVASGITLDADGTMTFRGPPPPQQGK